MKHFARRCILPAVASLACLLVVGVAQARDADASSSAYAFKSTVPGYRVEPAAVSSGLAPPAFDVSANADPANVFAGDWISGDELRSQAQGDSDHAQASSFSDDIEVHPVNGYKISTDGIKARFSTQDGASSHLDDVKLMIAGTEITLPADAPPNTPLSDVPDLAPLLQGSGISGVINEQGDNFVNALHLTYQDFDAGGAIEPVSGDVVFGHAEASMDGRSAANASGPGNADGDHQSPQPVVDDPVTALLPWRGMYFDPAQPGVGMTVEVDRDGHVFATLYAYSKDGETVFYIMQDRFQAADEQQRIQTRHLGSLDTTVFVSSGGQCIGADCAYQPADAQPTDYHAHLVWNAPRRVSVTIGDQHWDMRGGAMTVSDADTIAGTWMVSEWYRDAGDADSGQPLFDNNICRVSEDDSPLQPADFPVQRNDDGNVTAGVAIPQHAQLFRMDCTSGPLNKTGTWFIWYASASGRMGLFHALLNMDGSAPDDADAVQPDASLYIAGPQLLRGRRDHGGLAPSNGEIVFVRMPNVHANWLPGDPARH